MFQYRSLTEFQRPAKSPRARPCLPLLTCLLLVDTLVFQQYRFHLNGALVSLFFSGLTGAAITDETPPGYAELSEERREERDEIKGPEREHTKEGPGRRTERRLEDQLHIERRRRGGARRGGDATRRGELRDAVCVAAD